MKYKFSTSNSVPHCYLPVLVIMGDKEYWKSSVSLYVFILPTSSVCMPLLVRSLGSRWNAALTTLCGAARSVGKIAECWMRLACGWEWAELKLRKLSSEKMLLGSVNWGRSVRHNIRCCGQVLSALCQVCSESGPVVTPTCYRTAAAAATTVSVSLWPIGPCHCTLAELCTKSCSSFF